VIDAEALEGAYKRLQLQVHPDRFAGVTEDEARLAADASALAGEGYRTLANPVQRAQYLLARRGYDAIGEDVGTGNVAPQLLMHVMEVREAVEEAGEDQAALQAIRKENEQQRRAVLSKLEAAFGEEDLDRAEAHTVELQYLQKIDDEIKARLHEE